MAIGEDVSVREQTSLGGGFRRLFVASTLSNIGDGVVAPAFGLLAAALTREPLLVAAVPAAMRLPWLVVGPFAGAISDRADRRLMMVRVDAARFVLYAVLGVLILVDAVTIPILLVVALLSGVAETLFDTSAEAVVPAIVGRDQQELERANGLLQTSETIANRMAGPPIGGLLYAISASVPFLIDAITFGAASLVVSRLKGDFRAEPDVDTGPAAGSAEDAPQPAPATTLRDDVAEGGRWLWDDPLLRLITILAAVGNFALAAPEAILVLYAQDLLGLDAVGFGVLLGAVAAGAFLGSVVAAGLAGRMTTRTLLPITFVVAGLSQIAMGLTSSAVLAGTMLALISGLAVWASILVRALRQRAVPDRLLGRVASAQRAVALGMLPIGAMTGGLLADLFGLRSPFVIAGCMHLVAGGLAFGAMRRLRLPDAE